MEVIGDNVWWLLVPLAYFGGTFPSAQLVGRLAGHDPTKEGSGNPGASNVYRLAGKFPGAAVLVLDVLKGTIPTLIGLIGGGQQLAVAAGTAAIIGHVFPIQRRLRGGKGVATFGGMTIAAWPLLALVGIATWMAVMRLSKRASVGSMVGVVAVTVGVALTRGLGWEALVAAALCVLIIARHRSNIQRLLHREEVIVS